MSALSKCFLFLTVSMLMPLLLSGQANPKDSLLALVEKEQHDTAKVSKLLNYSKYYHFINLNYSLEFSLEALHLARETGDMDYIQPALLFTGVACYYSGIYDEAVRYYSEYRDNAIARGDKRELLLARVNLNGIRLVESNYDSLLDQDMLQALELAQELARDDKARRLHLTGSR